MQTHTDWECIIVNDGSPDDTEKVAREWCEKDSRFIYLKKENGGLSSARNSGLRIAKGDYIQFLDADDLIEDKKLTIQSAILVANESIDLVYSPARYFTSDNNTARYYDINLTFEKWQPEISGANIRLFEHLINQNIFCCNCPLVRKRAIDQVGLFNESLRSHEDYEYWIRLAINGSWFQFDETEDTFALVRVHNVSMSNDRLKMGVGYLLSKYMLYNHLLTHNLQLPGDLKFQLRNFKKELTGFYFADQVTRSQYESILTRSEKSRLRILPFIPKRLKFHFMMMDGYELKRIFNRINGN
jgi:glycosyltransferase involved in cell wall biosynthesis